MIRWLVLLSFLITSARSSTIVPGTIRVYLLPVNQIAPKTYSPSTSVDYLVLLENVPINDQVNIGIEIRGSNPLGGPRGYISMAHSIVPIKEFIETTNGYLQFQLVPKTTFAGYHWFLRPFVFFTNASMVSTNMMNSGASDTFFVLKQ